MGACCLGGDWTPAIGKSYSVLLPHTDRKHQAYRPACNERVYCDNDFSMGSSNLSFATRSCACVSVAFVAEIISLSVDYRLERIFERTCECNSECNRECTLCTFNFIMVFVRRAVKFQKPQLQYSFSTAAWEGTKYLLVKVNLDGK